jgi:hypothetical protein
MNNKQGGLTCERGHVRHCLVRDIGIAHAELHFLLDRDKILLLGFDKGLAVTNGELHQPQAPP